MPRKIVVFTGSLAYSVRKGIVAIDRALPDLQWLIVVGSPPRTTAGLLRNQWRNLLRNGWRWIPYQAGDLWHRLRERSETTPPPGEFAADYSLASLQGRPGIRLLHVGDINAPSTCAAVEDFGPDLGLSLAAPILRAPLFSTPRLGTVNLHKGQLPWYRGMPPAFWELWNDEQQVGCTVHRMDEKLDTGDIVRETRVERDRYSTLRALQLQLDEVGIDLTRAAVGDLLDGRASTSPQAPGGKTYRKPTLTQVAQLRKKQAYAQARASAPLKTLVTDAVGSTAFALWRMGVRRALTPRITVLLYHRVSDEARDNLTVGVEQFDRQMALVRKLCQPLSIEQVVDCSRIPPSDKPLVCVTFDDGYLDNYVHAAPILIRNRVPAAFFVSTGLIGTANRFPHDVRRGNPAIALMQWAQLREMRDSGFTIGSHSVSHIDCAAEPEDAVATELAQSLADLRRELGIQRAIFAYPYGGREHMTPSRLELVKRAGYSGCLSAYGGTNIGTVDPFNVLRLGIHWEFSDRALLLHCLGLR